VIKEFFQSVLLTREQVVVPATRRSTRIPCRSSSPHTPPSLGPLLTITVFAAPAQASEKRSGRASAVEQRLSYLTAALQDQRI